MELTHEEYQQKEIARLRSDLEYLHEENDQLCGENRTLKQDSRDVIFLCKQVRVGWSALQELSKTGLQGAERAVLKAIQE
jgi:cell division protein FtsB